MIKAVTPRRKRTRTVTRLFGLFMTALCLTMVVPLQWSAPAQAATLTTTVYASKDKYLNNKGGYSYWATSSDTLLYVGDQYGYIFGVNRTAVCFNLSDIAGKNISAAYLKIGIKYCSTFHNDGISIDVYGSDNDTWTEGDTSGTDTSFPTQNTLLTPAHYPIAFNNMPQTIWYSIDVTSFIQSEAAGDKLATLVLSPAVTGSLNECYFNSREGSDPIQLQVDYKVPSAALSASSAVTESNVNGAVVNVALEDGVTFTDATLDSANFSLDGAPFTISDASYTDSTHCNLTLAHTGADFDSNKSISVTIGSTELSPGTSLTTNTIDVSATNDAESITAAPVGTIAEGNENNKVINVTLSGGQLAPTFTASNWTIDGLPTGVSKGTVTRVDDTHATVTLSGNATGDYDSDITATVSCEAAEYTDSTGGDSLSADFTLTATNDAESITATPAVMITEGYENNKVINVALSGGQLAATLTSSNWAVSGLPAGVSKGTIARVDSTHATVTLSGNAINDYDSDITAAVSCTKSEYTDNTGGSNIMANFTLYASNDTESITAATDGMITEGSEGGEVIDVTLSGGQLAADLTPSNWTVSGLPAGVTKGEVTRVDNTHATVTLSGNATGDYDSDITATISCAATEYVDSTGGGAISAGFTLHGTNDAESMSAISDGLISEGSENGKVIDVTLSGGQLAAELTPSNWTILGLPEGVSVGTVTRVNDNKAKITLSGNATEDYDSDLTVAVSCTAAEYLDSIGSSSLTSNDLTIKALDDEESMTAASDGIITEGREDGKTIIVTLAGGTFKSILTAANWAVNGLPEGVSRGEVKRINKNTAEIKLSGNAVRDYDDDIALTVICKGTECANNTHNGDLSAAGAVLTAIKKATNPPVNIGQVAAGKLPAKAKTDTVLTIVPPAAPKGYTTTSISYSSTNPSIATVDAKGNVTFLAGGKVRITTKLISTMVDKKGKVKTKITTVKKTITVQQPVASVSLNTGSATIARKDKVKLTASIAPGTASNKKVVWKSSNPKVASVSSSGVVTGKAGGTAVITCMAKDGSGVSASCTVTVTPIYPTGIKLRKVMLTVRSGKTASLKATIAPSATDFKTLTWASSNPAVAAVDAKGRIKGIAPGTAVITATTTNGIAASCTVTVR